MILEKLVVGFNQANCYVFGDEKEQIIIDPGADYKTIKSFIDKHSFNVIAIVNTHGHADHIGANKNFSLPVWIHEADAEFLAEPKKNLSVIFGLAIRSQPASRILKDKDIIKVGGLELEVIHTPGHTPGSICLKHDNIVFTGDTLFREGIGRTYFPYGSEEKLLKSIKAKLLSYDNVTIYPGHGPTSSIAWEKAKNPFL